MYDEAHLSAEQPRAQAPSRFPVAFGDPGRPQGARSPSRTRTQVAFRLKTIERRADFLAANGSKRIAMSGFVLLVRERDDGDSCMRFGITVTKKIGNSVIRNRMKRRFRALAREVLPSSGVSGADHVLIGRNSGVERDFGNLRLELTKALARVRP